MRKLDSQNIKTDIWLRWLY